MNVMKKGGRPPKVGKKDIFDAVLGMGNEEITIRCLASELGVTPMTIYNNFGGMDDILDNLIIEMTEDVIKNLSDSYTFEETLRKVTGEYINLICSNQAVAVRVVLGNAFSRLTASCLDQLISYGVKRGLTASEAFLAIRSVFQAAVGCALIIVSRQGKNTSMPWMDPSSAAALEGGGESNLIHLRSALDSGRDDVLDPMIGVEVALSGLRAMYGERMTTQSEAAMA